MGCDEDARTAQELVAARGRRLNIQHVKARTGQVARVDGVAQGPGINQGAAADIDQERSLGHAGQELRIDHVGRFIRQGQVQ